MGKRYKIYYPTKRLVEVVIAFLREKYKDYIVPMRDYGDILGAAKFCVRRGKSRVSKVCWVAACIMYYFITEHPLVDGNKRTATLLTYLMLKKNGFYISWKSMYSIALSISNGRVDLEGTYRWVRGRVRKRKRR